MKILYGIQATGNGHISRAREIIPYLQQYGELDLILSGIQADVRLPHPVAYHLYGASFIFGKKGGVDIKRSLKSFRPINLMKDIRRLPVKSYDIVINDFDPVSAYACKLRGKPCYGLSHQSAFLSDKTPRPRTVRKVPELIFKHYAPVSEQTAFHFEPYDDFIRTPVVRSEIRQQTVSKKGHIVVYLPAFEDKRLIKHFNKVTSVNWMIFSKHTKTTYITGNVSVLPVNNEKWISALASAEGALLGAGFEGPAEALYLGKKLLVVPMTAQYEQKCNAAAIEKMGVKVIWKIRKNFWEELKDWLLNIPEIQVDYKDETAAIVREVMKKNGCEIKMSKPKVSTQTTNTNSFSENNIF